MLPCIIFLYSQAFGFRSLETLVFGFEMAITVHFTTVIHIFWMIIYVDDHVNDLLRHLLNLERFSNIFKCYEV